MVVEDGTADDDDDNDERMTEEREVALDGGGKFKEDLAPLHPRRTSQPASQPERDWLRNYYAKNFVKDTPKTCPIPTFHASSPARPPGFQRDTIQRTSEHTARRRGRIRVNLF